MDENIKNRPVIILFITIVLLVAAYFIPSGESLYGVQIKKVDMLMDVRDDNSFNDNQQNSEQELWDENDDFFKDDPPLEPDSLEQNNN